jgi:hypothetical protein
MSQSLEERVRPRRRELLLVRDVYMMSVLCWILTRCRIEEVQQEEVGGHYRIPLIETVTMVSRPLVVS